MYFNNRFDKKQIKILFQENMLQNTEKVIYETFNFLNISTNNHKLLSLNKRKGSQSLLQTISLKTINKLIEIYQPNIQNLAIILKNHFNLELPISWIYE